MNWTQAEAIQLATKLESIAPEYGAHIALSGGCLYREGPRKDLDIVVYRIRQKTLEKSEFLFALLQLGIVVVRDCGFVVKARTSSGRPVDFLFPEDKTGEYGTST